MIVLSHRGHWLAAEEKNEWVAFERTIADGFGTETDVRDHDGRLVISHDPAPASARAWSDLVDLFAGQGLPLAVNVKADGLSALLAEAFAGREIDWFAFDMSGPETVRYARAGLPYFTRHSDVEPEPVLYDQARGVWLDAFNDHGWMTVDVIRRHLDAGKRVCLVSPDLHGRPEEAFWGTISDLARETDALMLCTDLPLKAREYFRS